MTPIQFLFILFALFAITRAVRQFRAGSLTILWLILWIVFWMAVGAVTLAPQTTDILARFVGIGRGADVVVYASLVAIFYLVFRLFVKMEEVEREVTELVRKLALEEEHKEPRV